MSGSDKATDRESQETSPDSIAAKRRDYQIALRCDDLGLDDVVVKDVEMFRMERMSEENVWLCCYLTDGQRIAFDLWREGDTVKYAAREMDLPDVVYEEESVQSDAAAHGDDPTMAKADREVLNAAATGEGLIPITSSEQFRELAEAAQRTMAQFQDGFEAMTSGQAEFVRRLRCDEGYTWRAVAETCALEWGGDWGSNQLAGMAICERAAELHGEHYMEEPWN